MAGIPENPIQDFLSVYPKVGTQGAYATSLRGYLDVIYGPQRKLGSRANMTPEVLARYETLAGLYLTEDRDYAADIIRMISKSSLAPKTLTLRTAAVLEFLAHHGIDLSARDRRRIRQKVPKGGAISKRGDLTPESIRSIISHLEEHGRALVLVLASSGMRIGEVVKIRLQDIDLDAVPAAVHIRPEFSKSGAARVCFISSEAAAEVRTWLDVRDKYLCAASARASGCIKSKRRDDPRVFPFSIGNAEGMWSRAVAEAGLDERDERTNRLTLTPHSLRAWFSSQLGLGCPQPIVEELIGHEGYLTDAYRRYSRQQLAEHYLAAEEHILILVPQEFRELKGSLQKRQEAQAMMVEDLALRNRNLESRVASLEAENVILLEAGHSSKQITEAAVRKLMREEMMREAAAHE
jgi:integrase